VNDRPSAVELLHAVRDFLRNEVVPKLEGRERYHTRVAANVVAIVAREIETEEEHLLAEWRRLGALLDDDSAPPSERAALREGVALRTRTLVARIRAGDADAGPFRAAVLAHLVASVDAKLDVAQPPRPD
jgi:hypothetical protein